METPRQPSPAGPPDHPTLPLQPARAPVSPRGQLSSRLKREPLLLQAPWPTLLPKGPSGAHSGRPTSAASGWNSADSGLHKTSLRGSSRDFHRPGAGGGQAWASESPCPHETSSQGPRRRRGSHPASPTDRGSPSTCDQGRRVWLTPQVDPKPSPLCWLRDGGGGGLTG